MSTMNLSMEDERRKTRWFLSSCVCIQTGSDVDKQVFVHEYSALQVRASFAFVCHVTLHGTYE